MTQELQRVRIVQPTPVGMHIIRARTKGEVLKQLHHLSSKGYVVAASQLAEFRPSAGGGYGVKISLAKPLPQPMPGWAKGCALVGGVMIAMSTVALLALHALTGLVGTLMALPWAMIGGVAAVAFILAIATPVGRRCCSVVVNVWH